MKLSIKTEIIGNVGASQIILVWFTKCIFPGNNNNSMIRGVFQYFRGVTNGKEAVARWSLYLNIQIWEWLFIFNLCKTQPIPSKTNPQEITLIPSRKFGASTLNPQIYSPQMLLSCFISSLILIKNFFFPLPQSFKCFWKSFMDFILLLNSW